MRHVVPERQQRREQPKRLPAAAVKVVAAAINANADVESTEARIATVCPDQAVRTKAMNFFRRWREIAADDTGE